MFIKKFHPSFSRCQLKLHLMIAVFMVANRKGLLILGIALSSNVFSDTSIDSQQVIEFLKHQLAERTVEFSHRMEYCSGLEKNAPIPKISTNVLDEMGISYHDYTSAVYHLSNQNLALCEGATRLNQVYAVAALASAQSYYGMSSQSQKISQVNNSFIPSPREVELEIIYEKLPKAAQDYLQNAVGTSPFDVLATIEENKLIPDM